MDFDLSIPIEWPSLKHGQRYQAVLYIEKEGFEPLLEEAQIAERFDLAILSCKGQSVVAARHVCRSRLQRRRTEFPCLLFTISIKPDSRSASGSPPFQIGRRKMIEWPTASRMRSTSPILDCDSPMSRSMGLGSETVAFKGYFASDSIATPDEQKFLRSGRRVEFNAFTSPQFIEWLEAKLTKHGLGKRLIPEDTILADAYRRAVAVAHINSAIDGAIKGAEQLAGEAVIPKALSRQLRKAMKESGGEAWDAALYRIVQNNLEGYE